MTILLYLEIGIAIYIAAMFLILLLNYRGYTAVRPLSTLPETPPRVSVLLPFQNDADLIQDSLSSLARQDYPNLEIVMINRSSQDASVRLIEEIRLDYPDIRILEETQRLDEHADLWRGTTYALHQGALETTSEWLLFVAPNAVLQPDCVSQAMGHATQHHLDGLSLMPAQELRGFWQQLIFPIVFGWFGTRFSMAKVNDPDHRQAVAVGQFFLMKRTAYVATGGFRKVRKEVFEDSALAREMKSLGLQFRLLGAPQLLRSRTPQSLRAVIRGAARFFMGELGTSIPGILWTLLVIGLTGVAPFASFLACAALGFDGVTLPLLAVVVGQCVVVLTARIVLNFALRIGILQAFLHPIGSLAALGILGYSLYGVLTQSLTPLRGRVSAELHDA